MEQISEKEEFCLSELSKKMVKVSFKKNCVVEIAKILSVLLTKRLLLAKVFYREFCLFFKAAIPQDTHERLSGDPSV